MPAHNCRSLQSGGSCQYQARRRLIQPKIAPYWPNRPRPQVSKVPHRGLRTLPFPTLSYLPPSSLPCTQASANCLLAIRRLFYEHTECIATLKSEGRRPVISVAMVIMPERGNGATVPASQRLGIVRDIPALRQDQTAVRSDGSPLIIAISYRACPFKTRRYYPAPGVLQKVGPCSTE